MDITKLIKELEKMKPKDLDFGWEKGVHYGLRKAIELIKKYNK